MATKTAKNKKEKVDVTKLPKASPIFGARITEKLDDLARARGVFDTRHGLNRGAGGRSPGHNYQRDDSPQDHLPESSVATPRITAVEQL